MSDERSARARVSLEGLSVGDAFGETNIARIGSVMDRVGQRVISGRRPWKWTDDTAMALSIVETLAAHGAIDREDLARRFGLRYDEAPDRGYGAGAHRVLAAIFEGTPWQIAARALFGGSGSLGNGGGMRAAPIGAYFCDDLERAAREAAASADVTHAHPEGRAGAVGVAVAAAAVFGGLRDPLAILTRAIALTDGQVRDGLVHAARMLDADPLTVAAEVGNGSQVRASDTVPFAVWCAATHLDDYAGALWACCDVGGDVDTTCAMVGGIVAGAVGVDGIPAEWRAAREPLD